MEYGVSPRGALLNIARYLKYVAGSFYSGDTMLLLDLMCDTTRRGLSK